MNNPSARIPVSPTAFDERLRYSVVEASALLRQSRAKTWGDIASGKIMPIRDAGRTYVPGSEILRRSTLGAA